MRLSVKALTGKVYLFLLDLIKGLLSSRSPLQISGSSCKVRESFESALHCEELPISGQLQSSLCLPEYHFHLLCGQGSQGYEKGIYTLRSSRIVDAPSVFVVLS